MSALPASPAEVAAYRKAKAAGARWFASLRDDQKLQIADWDYENPFDWRDWFDDKPRPGFVRGLTDAADLWAEERAYRMSQA